MGFLQNLLGGSDTNYGAFKKEREDFLVFS